jgi:transcriptional regulator with GAF, ATPase, and Fis domain
VRELLGAVRRAAHAARAERRLVVEARDLEDSAGVAFGGAAAAGEGGDEPPRREPTRAEVEAALREARGNVTGAARRLGLHRNQLRRWLAKNPEVEPTAYE